MTPKQADSIISQTLSFSDICDKAELNIVYGSLVAAQEWANAHPSPTNFENIDNMKYYD